ncbi:MAG: reverse transcriptase domain-containing protein, partial [Thermonemataceae bacterium]|nr:reverse transcriptase domain-containing protein [Thermonemataceae bacterium]
MSEHLTRQQLYDRIRETSKDAYILEEMKRLGFWENSTQPTLSETLIQKEATLQKELNELLDKQRQYNSKEQLLRDMRKQKLKQSKEKQAETKKRNEEKRQLKAQKWIESKQKDIIYLGEKVSAGLHEKIAQEGLLEKYQLPHFISVLALAEAMQITLPQLRFLAFHRAVSKTSHYHFYTVPKKSGGKRLISAPKPLLKKCQRWILESILYKITPNECVHGFVPKKSIVSNAKPHLQKAIVINLDLKDFFPSISYKRVKGLFENLGYSEQIATILALLSTHYEVEKVNVDGEMYYVQKGERVLPQGSPASPAITTLIAYKMDKRLGGLAKKLGFTYTRYADDLTFSTEASNEGNVAALLHFTKQVVEEEGFVIHPNKTHIMRAGSQKKVTGIVVNDKLGVDRTLLHKFRAFLHQ